MNQTAFALVLNLHQPMGNLEHLLENQEWTAKEILYAIDRIPHTLWPYEDCARVHLALSGTLLETLSNPTFQERVYGIVDCGSLLWYLQNTRIIDILGTAYYHPVLPLIPQADRDEQLSRWRIIGEQLFNRTEFAGMWPPEMGFSMELIPLIRQLGYRYVLVDSAHVEAVTPMSWVQLRYLPHVARHGDAEIVVVVRDRELSDAQEYPPVGEVRIRTGAWNTGWHSGVGFTQWTGSAEQRAALARVAEVSRLVRAGMNESGGNELENTEALKYVLRAETSCNFFWGQDWLSRCHHDLDQACEIVTGSSRCTW